MWAGAEKFGTGSIDAAVTLGLCSRLDPPNFNLETPQSLFSSTSHPPLWHAWSSICFQLHMVDGMLYTPARLLTALGPSLTGSRTCIRRASSKTAAESRLQPTVQPPTSHQTIHVPQQTQRLPQTRPSDRGLYLTALVALLVTPPTVYYWWQHRAEHMGKKKADMIQRGEEARKAFLAKYK